MLSGVQTLRLQAVGIKPQERNKGHIYICNLCTVFCSWARHLDVLLWSLNVLFQSLFVSSTWNLVAAVQAGRGPRGAAAKPGLLRPGLMCFRGSPHAEADCAPANHSTAGGDGGRTSLGLLPCLHALRSPYSEACGDEGVASWGVLAGMQWAGMLRHMEMGV